MNEALRGLFATAELLDFDIKIKQLNSTTYIYEYDV